MNSKEKILEEFEKNVFGDCFAGGNFVDNEKQAMYTSGFKEGFNRAKNMSKQFLSQAIDQTREETIRLEQERIYAYVEEVLIGCDNKLLKDLSNIIFNKSN